MGIILKWEDSPGLYNIALTRNQTWTGKNSKFIFKGHQFILANAEICFEKKGITLKPDEEASQYPSLFLERMLLFFGRLLF